MSIEIKGLKELMKNLESAPDVLKKAEQKITIEMAKPIRDDAQKNAPRSTYNKNHMADNIKISTMKYIEGAATRKVEVKGNEFFYSYFVEYGTSKMEPKPFMTKAFLDNKDKIIKIAQEEVNKIMKKVVK